MQDKTRVLFVDDEAALRDMWSAILSIEGFEVTTVATVNEALARITSEPFHVLIADLNVGEAGDGFTIASAMRRLHPNAVTLILTGYPAFQAALRAIHEQVDDFLVKPTEPPMVIELIRRHLAQPRKPRQIFTERLSDVIAKHRQGIIEQWYSAVERDPEIHAVPLARDDRIDDLPEVLDELVRPMGPDNVALPRSRSASAEHGEKRREQGYTVTMLLEETRILHSVIADCMQKNLLAIDVSNLIPDLIEVHDRMHRILRHSLQAFLQESNKAA